MFVSLRRVVYQVQEMERAKQWYRGVLGKDPAVDMPFAVHFTVGDTGLTLAPLPPNVRNTGEGAIAYWEVADIDEEYRRLIDAGASPHTEVADVFGFRRGAVVDPFGNVIGLLGKAIDRSSRTVEEEPSGTALAVASLRAFAAMDEREEIRGRDTIAEVFLTEDRRRMAREADGRAWALKNAVPLGLYEYLIARTAYFDHAVEQALRENVPQMVFLGAGYDSRPYRFRELVRETRMFEVDALPTQKRKRTLLEKAGIPAPPGLSYVPIHFEKDSLEETLTQAGYDPRQRCLFLWEGVIYYLTAEAVDATLRFIRDRSAQGSSVVFDYLGTAAQASDSHISTELRDAMRANAPAEPIRFRIEKGEIGPFLSKRGYRLADHLTAQEMQKKYLTLRDGSSAGKVAEHMSLATAVTL